MAIGIPTFFDLPQTTAFFPNVSIPIEFSKKKKSFGKKITLYARHRVLLFSKTLKIRQIKKKRTTFVLIKLIPPKNGYSNWGKC